MPGGDMARRNYRRDIRLQRIMSFAVTGLRWYNFGY